MVKFQSGLSNSAALRAPVGLYLPTSKSPRFLFAMQERYRCGLDHRSGFLQGRWLWFSIHQVLLGVL